MINANLSHASIVEPLLDSRTTAKILGVCEKTVSNLVKRGKLIAVRLERRVMFDPSDVRAFIDRQKVSGPAAA